MKVLSYYVFRYWKHDEIYIKYELSLEQALVHANFTTQGNLEESHPHFIRDGLFYYGKFNTCLDAVNFLIHAPNINGNLVPGKCDGLDEPIHTCPMTGDDF